MSITVGDKIRYVATNEDGEVVSESKISPDCVMVRFGRSFAYLIEKDRLAPVAGDVPRTVIYR
jgi:hypothetical protein